METFREEHYEVEAFNCGEWFKTASTIDADLDWAQDIAKRREQYGLRVRIIRCTTIREVGE